jgi:cysteine desulfurase
MRAYFDHNATSPLKPAARAAALSAMELGNASSVHTEGRAARAAVDHAREILASFLGADPSMVIFTSGGTEANNLAIRGCAVERLIVSAIEHPSVLETALAQGLVVETLPVDGNGVIDIGCLHALLSDSKLSTLVSVMLANNETGVIQPVHQVARMCRNRRAWVHTDAVQAVGKIQVLLSDLDVDLLTVSAHKFGGPKGAGALVVREGLYFSPQLSGGGQELGRRAGTENVAAIAGFAAALDHLAPEIGALRDELEARLLVSAPQTVIFSRHADRLPNTSCFALPGLSADTALMSFDLDGVAVSTGSACSSGKVARSHVLDAMAIDRGLAGGAIRASLGWSTTRADIDEFIAAWSRIIERINRIAA